jgi:hypothetical protein
MRTTTKHTGRIEIKPGLRAIDAVRQAWQSAFRAACRHDGIEEDSKFVVFSKDNPFVPYIDRAHQEYCNTVREYQAGGYVGLRMS